MNKIVNSFLFSLCCFLASCGNSDDPVAESSTMHITSCYVVNNNTLSENLSSPIGLYITTVDNKPYGDSYRNYASLVHGNWMMNAPVYVENKGLVYSYYPYSESDTSPIVSLDMTKQVDRSGAFCRPEIFLSYLYDWIYSGWFEFSFCCL